MTPVQAVFFDLDGTLIDDYAAALRCAEAACRHFENGVPGLDPAAVTETYVAVANAYWKNRWTSGVQDDRTYRVNLWEAALKKHAIGVPGLADQIATLYTALRARAAVPFEDALPVVEALIDRGYRLAVITNGPADIQRYKLGLVGLDDYFDAVIASSDYGAGKPERVIFEAALNATGADPATTWHVGDNLAADVAGALNAGLRAAWLNRDGEPHPPEHARPDAELRTLWELPSVLPGSRRS
jgi:HAD superfamily hydrolase (TIGR01509 family)